MSVIFGAQVSDKRFLKQHLLKKIIFTSFQIFYSIGSIFFLKHFDEKDYERVISSLLSTHESLKPKVVIVFADRVPGTIQQKNYICNLQSQGGSNVCKRFFHNGLVTSCKQTDKNKLSTLSC